MALTRAQLDRMSRLLHVSHAHPSALGISFDELFPRDISAYEQVINSVYLLETANTPLVTFAQAWDTWPPLSQPGVVEHIRELLVAFVAPPVRGLTPASEVTDDLPTILLAPRR